jgi:glycogen phosphorylase
MGYCCRIFTPVQPVYSAASVRDFLSGALKRVMNSFNSGLFCPQEPDLFRSVYHSLLDEGDEYFHLADFQSYIETQDKIGEEFKRRPAWARKAVLNVARIGKFSSDRTIREYAREIWNIESV